MIFSQISKFAIFLVFTASCKPMADTRRSMGGSSTSGSVPEAQSGNQTPGAVTPEGSDTQTATEKALTEHDVLHALPSGAEQIKVICSRPGKDKVRTVFCGATPPSITSLVDLQRALGLAFTDPTLTGRGNNGSGGNPGFVITGHSSSLVARFTSAINPRAILFTPLDGNDIAPDYVAMGFLRGEQFAEIIARDPSNNQLAFFLVNFEQACNAAPGGCKIGELLTPTIEKNWTKLSIYEDLDLENTIIDCKQCHQPGGPTSPKMLRMQELQNPWTHFFRDNRPGGQALIADYTAAHGTDEDLAGIPGALVNASDPANLEDFVRAAGFGDQPNEMRTKDIDEEVVDSNPAQPADNSVPGVSPRWQAQYEQTVNGQFIPMPYHDVKVTDRQKLATMTSAYQSFKAGSIPAQQLPDIREVFLDSALHEIGFRVKPGLTGRQVLVQACTQCHNSRLNQQITRAKFNVEQLEAMSRQEKDLAIERLQLPDEHLQKMPPRRFKSLTPEDIAKAVEELRK
ncbi:MAG: hypothetical protein AB7T49_11265 [Oligoflexales bacterium]